MWDDKYKSEGYAKIRFPLSLENARQEEPNTTKKRIF
jgi:hypothetical protein